MSDFKVEKAENLLLINPNLGHPIFLNIDSESTTINFQTCLLFVSDTEDSKKIQNSLKNNLELIPILEYKWKLRFLLEKRKKGLWTRIKEKLTRKKKKKKKKSELPDLEGKTFNSILDELKGADDERLKRLKHRVLRGDPIFPDMLSVEQVFITPINSPSYINDEFCSPQEYLLKNNVFGNLDKFYKVTIEFNLSEEVFEFLKHRNFVMFDLVHETSNSDKRINYHSLVVLKKRSNFSFIHATDLHLAERNDQIYGIIHHWIRTLRGEHLKLFGKKQEKKIKKKNNKKKNSLFTIDLSFKKRLINPNNNFRKFIKETNKKVLRNELDFVVITGDIVDFSIMSRLPRELRKIFDYKYSNWQVFKNITLNSNQYKRKGIIKGEELLCPVFTIPGNHDYRPFHYDLRWGGMYRKMGLNAPEAIALNDKLSALPITAIIKNPMALKGYLSEINPSLDFSLRFGNNFFIFLNSGSDSFKNVRDFLTGRPSVTGLSNKQIKYLENLMNNKIQENDNVFLLLHAPPINTKKSISIFKRFGKKFSGKAVVTQIEELKESLLRRLGKKTKDARIDDKMSVKVGTVSSNWNKLIKFCKDYCIMTLAGHTHALKEFRLGEPENGKTKVFNAPPFSLKKVENPAAIYYDLYSEIYTTSKDIEKHAPFIVQTPALGLGGYYNPKLAGAYRELKIVDGKLSSFKVKFINR
ncbi:MAG: metallophosphoesterase [Promethearchaeota archaeon]